MVLGLAKSIALRKNLP